MSYEVNEEKREKFMEFAGKRVNNVLHDIQILEPMARSNNYDFTKQDVDEMFNAMQEVLNEAKEEFYKKFEEKARATKKVFSFGSSSVQKTQKTIDIVEEAEEIIDISNVEEMEEDNIVADVDTEEV